MHADPELLGLLAIGEIAGTDDERVHAETCPDCARELGQLRRLVELARGAGPETLAPPGPEVWSRIQAELGLTTRQLADEPDRVPSTTSIGSAGREASRVRRSPWARIRAWLTAGSGRRSAEPSAHIRLSPVEAFWSKASATAEVSTDEHGRRVLQLDLDADLPASGLRQAWLVHRDDPSQRQTLGILDGRYGVWTIDHSIDLGSYAILEVSQQPTGETDYSGQPIVRGELTLRD